jgi:Trk K+ transport system NAD-binding subunit/Kef-type K+ transport system membrane component KefB
MTTVTFLASFIIISLAAYLIGKFFTRLGLPYITGYLFTGALAGPFLLDLLPADAVTRLRFVDQLSLAVIAFVAGSELYLKEIRQRLRSIFFTASGIAVIGLIFGTGAIFALTNFLSFTQGRPFSERMVIAALGAVVLLALSPPTTIAVIKEVRAKGPFTRTVLSVTVFMDVLIIVLFAITTSLASVFLTNVGLSGAFLVQLTLDLGLAVILGLAVGKLLELVLKGRLSQTLKIGLVLLIGYGVYFLSDQVKVFSPDLVGYEVYIEPLLICLIAGFIITNFTEQRHQFDEILHTVGPAVYVAFFTLTGISLKLDILVATLPIAIALFLMRIAGIYGGTFIGSRLAQESETFKKYAWMAFITQAGIALGLAREAAIQFPSLGAAFSTTIIAVIVLNEIFGPMLLKESLKRAGEANIPGDLPDKEPVRDAVILGVELQSVALARELQEHNWRVIMADTDASHVEALAAEDVDERHIPEISRETLAGLITVNTDAVVAMLDNDADNLKACEFARDKFDVPRLIVRPHDAANIERFMEFDVFIVDPTSAMVGLLEQAVIAPQSAALMLFRDPDNFEFVQCTVTNPDVDGMLVRDLRLPSDVRILGVKRGGHSILPSGYTPIHVGDDLTLVGIPSSLEEATLRLGY